MFDLSRKILRDKIDWKIELADCNAAPLGCRAEKLVDVLAHEGTDGNRAADPRIVLLKHAHVTVEEVEGDFLEWDV